MKQGTMQADIAETLLELGKSTTTQSAQAVNKTFNPLKIVEQVATKKEGIDQVTGEKITEPNVPNSTKLDVKKLQEKYKGQDDIELTGMRNRLFKLVKEGEEKAIAQRKQEEEMRKKQELTEEEDKKKKQQQADQQPQDIPRGKERRTIFSAHKKKAMEQHVETKPSVSKS